MNIFAANNDSKNPEANDLVRRFFSRAYVGAAPPYVAMGLLLIVAIVFGGREIEHHVNAIESWITELGPWGVLGFVGLFVMATSLLLPDTVMCITAGALFGLGWSVGAVLVSSVLATHWLIVAQEAGCRLDKPFYQMALSDYGLRTPMQGDRT